MKPFEVTAVILAAGQSSRMKALKPLLPIQGIPMLQSVIDTVLAFPFVRCLCVVGNEAELIRQTIQVKDERFQWIYNADFALGQSTSLKLAAKQVDKSGGGMMVFLGDQPFIEHSTIKKVFEAAGLPSENGMIRRILQPSYQGAKGHPVYISGEIIPLFVELEGDTGAKAIFNQAQQHLLIPVDDEGILIDIDTPNEYAKYKSGLDNRR